MKRGQTTIFIILGLVLVLIVVLFFALKGTVTPDSTNTGEIDLDKQFSGCVEKSLIEKIEILSRQGGYISNKLNLTFRFEDEEDPTDIAYLCYQKNNYLPCINQQPMLISHLEKELKRELEEEVEICFNNLVEKLEEKYEKVVSEYSGFDLKIYSGRVVLTVNGDVSFEKSGATSSYSGLRSIYYTKFYELVVVAQEIISQEARFCSFEQVGFSLIYPEYSIHKFRTGDSNLIYTVTDKKSGEFFRFVIRGCVIPPGF